MAFSGPIQGGTPATILVLDHPQSFRHPTSWYLINKMPYFSPAMLYHSPHTLARGQSMTLKYRIVFQPGPLDRDAAEKEWQQFAAVPR